MTDGTQKCNCFPVCILTCARCQDTFEVPAELIGEQELLAPLCGHCQEIMDEQMAQAALGSVLEDDPSRYCPHCGKEYEDFSDMGCGHCDRRSPEWGTVE